MLSIKDIGAPPKERWRYPSFDPNIADRTARDWHALYRVVKEHYETNGKPVPSKQDIVDWVCRNLTVSCTDDNREFQNKYTNPPVTIRRGPSGVNWPLLLLPMKALAKEGDRGLGDIIERVVGPVGGTLYKKWYLQIFGKSCGCQERKETLNFEYPLG